MYTIATLRSGNETQPKDLLAVWEALAVATARRNKRRVATRNFGGFTPEILGFSRLPRLLWLPAAGEGALRWGLGSSSAPTRVPSTRGYRGPCPYRGGDRAVLRRGGAREGTRPTHAPPHSPPLPRPARLPRARPCHLVASAAGGGCRKNHGSLITATPGRSFGFRSMKHREYLKRLEGGSGVC